MPAAGLVEVAGALLGMLFGVGAGQAAARLPRRYGVRRELARSDRRRDLVLAASGAAVGAGAGHLLAGAAGPGGLSSAHVALLLVFNTAAVATALALAAIDVEHRLLPSELTLGGTVVALATSPLRAVGWRSALIGVAIGAGLAWLPSFVFARLRPGRGPSLGGGDVKLAAFAGAWHGAEGVFFVLLLGGLQAVLAAAGLRLAGVVLPVPRSVREEIERLETRARAGDAEATAALAADPMARALSRDDKNEARSDGGAPAPLRLPLGLFLALACLEVLFLRRTLVALVWGAP